MVEVKQEMRSIIEFPEVGNYTQSRNYNKDVLDFIQSTGRRMWDR